MAQAQVLTCIDSRVAGGVAFATFVYYACIICISSSLFDLSSRSVNQLHAQMEHTLFSALYVDVFPSNVKSEDQQTG